MTIAFSDFANLAIVEQWEFYAAQQGLELADRWQSSVASTIDALLVSPERGSLCRLPNPLFAQVRWIPVNAFPFRLFYFFDGASQKIVVLHLLHQRRDIADLLERALG